MATVEVKTKKKELKVKDRILNYFEDFSPKYEFKIRWPAFIGTIIFFQVAVPLEEKLRGYLPEIIDIFYHTGNADAIVPAVFVAFPLGKLLARYTALKQKTLFAITVVTGTIVGLAANLFIESKPGMEYLKQINVSDPMDVFYGTLFCLIILVVSAKFVATED
jgi:hypothetical protein